MLKFDSEMVLSVVDDITAKGLKYIIDLFGFGVLGGLASSESQEFILAVIKIFGIGKSIEYFRGCTKSFLQEDECSLLSSFGEQFVDSQVFCESSDSAENT